MKAGRTVQTAPLPDIGLQEGERRAGRRGGPEQAFEGATQRRVVGRPGIVPPGLLQRRHPVGIAVVAVEPGSRGLGIPVQQRRPQPAGRPVQARLVMAFHLPDARQPVILSRRKGGAAAVEQAELAVAGAKAQRFAGEDRPPIDEIAGLGRPSADQRRDLRHQRRGQDLVGIQQQHPIMGDQRVRQAPLLFLRMPAVPAIGQDQGAPAAGDGRRAVGAGAVGDDHLGERPQGGQAGGDVDDLVAGRDDHADRDAGGWRMRHSAASSGRPSGPGRIIASSITPHSPTSSPAAAASANTGSGGGQSGRAGAAGGSAM